MFTNERKEEVYIYTTANESNIVYTKDRVWLMRSVCMIKDTSDSDNLDWVLHTGSCNHVSPMRRIFNISGKGDPSDETAPGYYFSFIKGSSVTVSIDPKEAGTAHFLMNTDPKKAAGMNKDCGNTGQDIPVSVFENTGYYYVCIIPNEKLSFVIDVNELYYSRPITHECNNIVHYGSVVHRCCNFGFSDSFTNSNCVYLTTRNQQVKQHLPKPHQVTVYMEYSDTVKTLTVVVVVAMVLAVAMLLSLAVYRVYRARRAPRQPQVQH